MSKRRPPDRAAFLALYPGLEADLATDHRIVNDIRARFEQWSRLSPAQVALVQKLAAGQGARMRQRVDGFTVDEIRDAPDTQARIDCIICAANALAKFPADVVLGVGIVPRRKEVK